MTPEDKAFCKAVRDHFDLSVESLGTRPVRIRAWPRGENWQGWYAQGKTRPHAYRNLVRVFVRIPAYYGDRDAERIIKRLKEEARASVHRENEEKA